MAHHFSIVLSSSRQSPFTLIHSIHSFDIFSLSAPQCFFLLSSLPIFASNKFSTRKTTAKMKYSGFLASSAMVAMANAHATIFSAYVDDVSQGVGNSAAGYIRSPPNNNPVKDLTSDALTCNVNNVATAKTIDVPAGSKVRGLKCNKREEMY